PQIPIRLGKRPPTRRGQPPCLAVHRRRLQHAFHTILLLQSPTHPPRPLPALLGVAEQCLGQLLHVLSRVVVVHHPLPLQTLSRPRVAQTRPHLPVVARRRCAVVGHVRQQSSRPHPLGRAF